MRPIAVVFTQQEGKNFAKMCSFPTTLSQILSHPLNLFRCNKFSISTKRPATLTALRSPFSIRVRSSTRPAAPTGDATPVSLISKQQMPDSPPHSRCFVAAAPPIAAGRKLGLRPTPELGLMSNLFVLTMAFGAFFSVAVVSIPTLLAFGRLGASVNKLSKVVSEEVPGTLSSLKLSSMELNDLTQQLSNLRHKISGVRTGKKDGSTTSSRSYRKNSPAS